MKENLKKLFAVVLAVAMLAAQVVVPTNAATNYYCSVCEEDAELSAGATELRKIEPTCGKDGYLIYACENPECEDGTITVVVPATGTHTGTGTPTQAVPSSCTAAGTVAYDTCTGCGAYLEPGTSTVLSSIVDPIDAHSYVDTVTPPDCTNDGYTTHVCSVCGDTKKDTPTTCTGHDFQPVSGKAATCKEEGYTDYEECANTGCDVINPEKPKTVIAIQDHNLHLDKARSEDPTCTQDGFDRFVCDEPTCVYYKGANNDGEGVKVTVKSEGHDLTPTAANAATCTAAGNHAYWTCSVCNGIYKTAAAAENAKFANLDETVIPATGHTEIAIAYKEATCNEEGARDGIMCVVCKEILHASVKTPAHSFNV